MKPFLNIIIKFAIITCKLLRNTQMFLCNLHISNIKYNTIELLGWIYVDDLHTEPAGQTDVRGAS